MAEATVEIDQEMLDQVRKVLGTETLQDTIDSAFREVLRVSVVRGLIVSPESGAFAAVLEPAAEEKPAPGTE